MNKNVLELIGSFRRGGSERQAVQLCRLLHSEGSYKVFVGTLDREGDLRREVEQLGIKEIPEFKLTSFFDIRFARQVLRCADFIRENHISVVHTHDFYTNIFGMVSSFWARVPVRIASKRETFSKSRAQLKLERQAFRLASRILANANAVKEFLVETGVKNDKIVTVYNGLDLERLAPPEDLNRTALLHEFNLPVNGNQVVTIVANLRSEVKNHEMFLRTARGVVREIPDVTFVVAGEGELTESLQLFAAELGIAKNVLFTGRCTKVAELLSISDVCVLSSRSEGFSNSILEYMAAAKPVVATRVGGASEAIIEGETGFLVESDDHEGMTERLVRLVRDPRLARLMGAKGRKVVEEKFSLTAQLEKTLALYELASKTAV